MRHWILLLGLLLLSSPVVAGTIVGEQPTYAREQGFQQVFAYVNGGNGDGQIEYQGLAQSDKATSASNWQIRKFTYDSSNRISTIKWANGSDDFKFIWDNRTGYTY